MRSEVRRIRLGGIWGVGSGEEILWMVVDCGDSLEEQPLLFRTISFLIHDVYSRWRAKVLERSRVIVFNGLTGVIAGRARKSSFWDEILFQMQFWCFKVGREKKNPATRAGFFGEGFGCEG